jgi:hypothetical protein
MVTKYEYKNKGIIQSFQVVDWLYATVRSFSKCLSITCLLWKDIFAETRISLTKLWELVNYTNLFLIDSLRNSYLKSLREPLLSLNYRTDLRSDMLNTFISSIALKSLLTKDFRCFPILLVSNRPPLFNLAYISLLSAMIEKLRVFFGRTMY